MATKKTRPLDSAAFDAKRRDVGLMIGNCKDCRFFLVLGTSGHEVVSGQCRRYPPAVLLVGTELRAVYPVVAPSEGCGEFRPVLK